VGSRRLRFLTAVLHPAAAIPIVSFLMVALSEELLPEEIDVLARTGGAGLDVHAMMVVQNTHRAAAALRTQLEADALVPAGLTWGSFTMLFCLWVWGPLETRELAVRMGVARPTVSGVTDTLERRGLVGRTRDPGDRRLVTVSMTEAGERTFAELFPRFNRSESRACGALSTEESTELARLLRRLVRSIRLQGGPDGS
jgi:DNA-binding MarR family transcriptional regulator